MSNKQPKSDDYFANFISENNISKTETKDFLKLAKKGTFVTYASHNLWKKLAHLFYSLCMVLFIALVIMVFFNSSIVGEGHWLLAILPAFVLSLVIGRTADTAQFFKLHQVSLINMILYKNYTTFMTYGPAILVYALCAASSASAFGWAIHILTQTCSTSLACTANKSIFIAYISVNGVLMLVCLGSLALFSVVLFKYAILNNEDIVNSMWRVVHKKKSQEQDQEVVLQSQDVPTVLKSDVIIHEKDVPQFVKKAMDNSVKTLRKRLGSTDLVNRDTERYSTNSNHYNELQEMTIRDNTSPVSSATSTQLSKRVTTLSRV